MNKKIISIFVSMLLFVTVFSVTGAVNIEKTVNMKSQSATTGIVWEDDFDSYTLYQFLDGTPDDGGWRGWDGAPSAGATVTGNQSLSSPHSVDIVGPSDTIREYIGIASGTWTYIAWVYVPGDMVGQSYFILLGHYEDFGGQTLNKWALQIRFDAAAGNVVAEHDGDELDLIPDQWVEMRVEIDLEDDWFECYYDNELLQEKNWTAGPNNEGDTPLSLEAVDLYANSATSVYYDDMSLDGEVGSPAILCEGDLHFGNVSRGSTVERNFTVENVGGGLLDWEITKEPSWGTWTFEPESGDDLPPGAPVTVQVTVVTPKEQDDWTSTIIVTNMENPDNTCTIDVSMTTPRSQPYLFLQFLERLIQRFPVLELIFSRLLG